MGLQTTVDRLGDFGDGFDGLLMEGFVHVAGELEQGAAEGFGDEVGGGSVLCGFGGGEDFFEGGDGLSGF